jgi:hypothetical protein
MTIRFHKQTCSLQRTPFRGCLAPLRHRLESFLGSLPGVWFIHRHQSRGLSRVATSFHPGGFCTCPEQDITPFLPLSLSPSLPLSLSLSPNHSLILSLTNSFIHSPPRLCSRAASIRYQSGALIPDKNFNKELPSMRRSFAPEGGDGGGLKEQSIVTRYIV